MLSTQQSTHTVDDGDERIDGGEDERSVAGHRSRSGRPRVVAVDYDGTLTQGRRPAEATIAAVAAARSAGLYVVLVSGRIFDELEADFADVTDHFDALVLENGAEVLVGDRTVTTGPPLDRALGATLATEQITHRRGHVIVATTRDVEHRILDIIIDLGLECQLVRNRNELMVLPSGTNKGVGLRAALAELGVSPHDAIGVGDAENDHSLLATAGLGVAVANAVPSLAAEADVVLDEADGEGVVTVLEDAIGSCTLWSQRRRPTLTVGRDHQGEDVVLPAVPSNIVITAGTGEGKSFLAGLLAEQLIEARYSVLVVDPEGDHVGLGVLASTVILGGDRPPPPVDTVVGLLERSDVCVILDLSGLDSDTRREYLTDLPTEVEACRRVCGRPHWVVFDEAHESIASGEATRGAMDPAGGGYCLVTWRPEQLPPPLVAATDVVLALTSLAPDDDVIELVSAVGGDSRERAVARLTHRPGHVVVARRDRGDLPRPARLADRRTPHLRHEHKYDTDGTPWHRSFWFRAEGDRPTGEVARSLADLESELAHCDRTVLRHHVPRRDFSHWIDDVFRDRRLASTIARIEARLSASSSAAEVDAVRLDLVHAIRARRHSMIVPRARR